MANYQSTHTGAEIDAGIDKANKALVKSDSAPASTSLVAVDNSNAQKMLTIGDGLSVENGTLKATGGSGGASIGGGFTLIFNGNINSPIYVLCGNLSYTNTSNENIVENWFGWHTITDTRTTATCNNAVYFSVSGTTFKTSSMTNSNNIIDFTGAKIDYSIAINKMYYLIGDITMMSDD